MHTNSKQKEKYDNVATKIRDLGGYAQYPVVLPECIDLEHKGIRFRHIKCEPLLSFPRSSITYPKSQF